MSSNEGTNRLWKPTDQTRKEGANHPQGRPPLRYDQIMPASNRSSNSSDILNQQQIFDRLALWGTGWHNGRRIISLSQMLDYNGPPDDLKYAISPAELRSSQTIEAGNPGYPSRSRPEAFPLPNDQRPQATSS